MFYDLCYYVLLPMIFMTSAAGVYYITDPVGAKKTFINVSWNATKMYVNLNDGMESFLKKMLPDEESSDEDESSDSETEDTTHYIFYNNKEHNSYITDNIDKEIMEKVNDKISPSIMFIRKLISDTLFYKRTKNPIKMVEYETLEEKLFIQVEYITKDENGKETVKDIHSNLPGFYVNGNTILDRDFLEWYLEQFYSISNVNEYELRIFDKDVNMFTLQSDQSIKIVDNAYTIISKEDIDKEDEKEAEEENDEGESKNDEPYEGATEE